MKKVFMFFAALVITVMASAQTVEGSKLFENTYVTVLGGGTTTGQLQNVPTPFFWDGTKGVFNSVRPFAGVEFGKYFTPVVGASVEGLGFFGTTTSHTIFDESVVLGNGKVNLFNLFGYKGYPRRVEVVLVGGLGWGHDYVGNNQTWTSFPAEEGAEVETVYGIDVNAPEDGELLPTDKNYLVYNSGLEVNFNLGEKRAWQITFRPGVLWFNKANDYYQSVPTWKHDARVNAQLGVTYKFGSRTKNSHNFVLCPYSVTQAEYDALKAAYDALAAREPEVREVVKEVETVKEVEVIKVSHIFDPHTVRFQIGSARLTELEKSFIKDYVESVKIDEYTVIGSADSKTGSAKRNEELSYKRADAVVKYLETLGRKAQIKTTLDVVDGVPEASRVALICVE